MNECVVIRDCSDIEVLPTYLDVHAKLPACEVKVSDCLQPLTDCAIGTQACVLCNREVLIASREAFHDVLYHLLFRQVHAATACVQYAHLVLVPRQFGHDCASDQ